MLEEKGGENEGRLRDKRDIKYWQPKKIENVDRKKNFRSIDDVVEGEIVMSKLKAIIIE